MQSPPDLEDTIGEASRLNSVCQYEAADALMQQAITRLPKSAPAFVHYVRLARDRGDWFGVIARARDMRERFPNHVHGHLSPIEALRQLCDFTQAEELASQGLERFPGNPWFLVESAFVSEYRGDWQTAAATLTHLRKLHGDKPMSWIQSARSFSRGGRIQEADAVLSDAVALFPDNAELHALYAAAAEGLAEWQEADRRWENARARFPASTDIALGHALVWSTPAGGLRKLRDWPKVFARFSALHEAFPDFAAGFSAHIRKLRETEQLQQAESLGRQAGARFPKETGVAIELARVIRSAAGPAAAADALAEAVAANPHDPQLHAERAIMLMEAGRLEEAEALCMEAATRFRYHPRPLIALADIAMRRSDPETALARSIEGAGRFPQHPAFPRGVATARLALAISGAEAADQADMGQSGSIRQLLLRFESLGGPGMGCELGLVQRRAGAEPLGLLRWAGISLPMLLDALATRFEGVGTPAQTELILNPDTREYTVLDRRFAMQTHTFVREDQTTTDRFFDDCCQQTAYLRRKLLRDLENASKIFVFRFGETPPRKGEPEALFQALQTYGTVNLLCILNTDDEHTSGHIDALRPGLLLGYVPELRAWGLSEVAIWHEICRRADQK